MPVCLPCPLIECLRAQTTSTKTPVLEKNCRGPIQFVSPYLNPHISAGSWRMKTTKRPLFIVTSRRFIFRSQFFFFFHLHLQLPWLRHVNATSTSFELQLKVDLTKIFWDRQYASNEASYYKPSISCLRKAWSRWATRALELDLR
jgi:hypothetical protein